MESCHLYKCPVALTYNIIFKSVKGNMFNVKFILKISIFLLVIIAIYFWIRPSIYKRQIVFEDSAKSVQDSMIVLQKICESVNDKDFINCIIIPIDGDTTFTFNTVSLGSFKSVSPSDTAFKNMERADAVKLLSIMTFLSRNHITGIYHDTAIGLWVYPYGTDFYDRNINYIRNLYIWNEPKDTLSPSFEYYYKILDRKENIVLLAPNDVRYREFQK